MLPTAVIILLLVVLDVGPVELLLVWLQVAPDQLLLVVHHVANHVPPLLVWLDHPRFHHGGLLLGWLPGVPATSFIPLACSPLVRLKVS